MGLDTGFADEVFEVGSSHTDMAAEFVERDPSLLDESAGKPNGRVEVIRDLVQGQEVVQAASLPSAGGAVAETSPGGCAARAAASAARCWMRVEIERSSLRWMSGTSGSPGRASSQAIGAGDPPCRAASTF